MAKASRVRPLEIREGSTGIGAPLLLGRLPRIYVSPKPPEYRRCSKLSTGRRALDAAKSWGERMTKTERALSAWE
jgi:hypothetical protein